MTAKDKAKELMTRFNFEYTGDKCTIYQTPEESKRCALIAVDEILNLCWNGNKLAMEYWQEVKQEIENL